MCKLGDIIVIDEFKDEDGVKVSKHSFVVTNDEPDKIEGLYYDFVSNMLCSFHDKKHKKKKLKYKENMPIKTEYVSGEYLNDKEGFIKADKLYYFDKRKIKYHVFAHVEPELLDELAQLMIELYEQNKLTQVLTNIEEKETVGS